MPFWHVDAGAALMLVLLAALEEGLGAGVYGVPVEDDARVRELLGIPDDLTIVDGRHRRPPGRGSRLGSRDERLLPAPPPARRGREVEPLELVERLAAAEIGGTYNQYAELRSCCGSGCARYLEARAGAQIVLVGEAAGYRGARVSGIPFTSERQLTGSGPAEATATIVHRVLAELGVEDEVLLWNVVPTHPGDDELEPRADARARSRRRAPFLEELVRAAAS